MTEGVLLMSHREIDRLKIMQSLRGKHIKQAEAAVQLGLSVRQVKRLQKRFREQGAQGLVSGHRGRRANNALAEGLRHAALALVREHYHDFGPTLAWEKLTEKHGCTFSVETLRKWMIADGLWVGKSRKAAKIHPSRPRRSCRGELVQIDGSPHDWFEGRAPRCTLIVFIDDATGALQSLRFAPTETTQAYMETLRGYLDTHGRPVALYSDRHSIFRVNHKDHEGELTQFSRALKTLDIQAIHARTPQAKGRVERANQTLQDRLVKELRLNAISNIEEANAFLPAFMAEFNTRFASEAQTPHDAHRPVLHSAQELDLILALHHTRTLSKNLAVQFRNQEFQLHGQGQGYRLRGAQVTIIESFAGEITVMHQGTILPYRRLTTGESPIPLADEKSIHHTLEQARIAQALRPNYKPSPDHPWRKGTPSQRFSATP